MDEIIARPRLDWVAAFKALRRLVADGDDTTQVFVIMNALNADETRGYHRLLTTRTGGRLAYERIELAERFTDASYIASFAPGTVGAAYRSFLAETGYSADGLAEVSMIDAHDAIIEHPHEWFGRRTRDVHDIWHILTGYKADETMGEAALVAFSFAQTGGLGWGLIAVGVALQSVVESHSLLFAKAVWEGYRIGRAAKWLLGEDYEVLLNTPLEEARRQLRIATPSAYLVAQRKLPPALVSFASRPEARA